MLGRRRLSGMTRLAEATYAGGALVVQRRDEAAWVTLNRPESKNAITPAMLKELPGILAQAASCSSVVFTGAGEDSFSSGFDLRDLDEGSVAQIDALITAAYEAVSACAVPTIACIGGWCIGAGLELALACDLRVCSRTSVFQLPAGRIGVDYPEHGLARIRRAAGAADAMRIVLLSERFSAEEAATLRLVHTVVDDPNATATAWANRIAQSDARALGGMRRTLRSIEERASTEQ